MDNISLTKVVDGNIVYFKEAKLVFVCKKMYVNQINEVNVQDDIKSKFYSNADFSYEYIGQIEKILINE